MFPGAKTAFPSSRARGTQAAEQPPEGSLSQMHARLLLLAAASAATVLSAHAVTYGAYPLEGEVGSGANTSICVFDFGGVEYAFGYHYDGAKTGADLLAALNGNFGIAIAYHPVYGTPTDISYGGYSISNDPIGDDYTGYPGYYVSGGSTLNQWVVPPLTIHYDGGGTNGPAWLSSDAGLASRSLVDGSWDGWVQAKFDNVTWVGFAAPPDGTFASVVPEPAALSLLAVGALALFGRRRR